MKRPVAFVLAALFFFASAAIWVNGPLVESWLAQQFVIDEQADTPLVGLQSNEEWLVILVDFSDHPATEAWGVDEAENLLQQAAVPYIDQLSSGTSTLSIHVHSAIVRASEPLAAYGADGASKDTDESGKFLPMILAEEVVSHVSNDVNWSQFDLDEDSVVDRLLILHTSKGQEENPGIDQRIWSHFTRFERSIEVGEDVSVDHYTMASLQTGSSGVGTMLHEMLHQMGAADLYPVHDESSFQAWKGPGDWDIMASGNWNGGGRWPALPTGATLELIGAPQVQELVLQWPSSSPSPCIGPTVALEGLSEEGMVLKISIAEHESVFIEHRSDHGYDERLPGHGVLVTYQDLSVGNLDQNELNTNPNLPWLKVVEADEGDELVSGANQGEASDLFTQNMTFGSEGVEIRTHDGLLVPWYGKVTVVENTTTISFQASDCTPPYELDFPDHGATVLPDQSVDVEFSGDVEECTSSLLSSDGRGVSFALTSDGGALVFSTRGTANSIFSVTGSITCDGHSVDLDYPIRIMNRIPQPSSFKAVIDPYETTILDIAVPSDGSGQQNLAVHVDGPLSRIAEAPASVNLDDGALALQINPRDLLVDNMLIHGEIVLMTEEGISWKFDVTLSAQSDNATWMPSWVDPSLVLGLLMALGGIYSLMAAVQKPTPNTEEEIESSPKTEVSIDPWGRPVDEEVSSTAFDIEM